MAKQVYKIPAALDEGYQNMEIALQNKEGIGLKPMPLRVIFTWVFGLFFWFYMVMNGDSFLKYAGWGGRIVFSIFFFGLMFVLTKVDKCHRMNIEYLPAMINYLPKTSRLIKTRRAENAGPFYGIVGIDSIDDDGPNKGLVTHIDGSYSYWYSIVGSASVLLFPEDRDAILDRVDSFYKKIQPDCEIIYVTLNEAQNVTLQKAHLIAQYRAMEFTDPDIDTIVKEQYKLLDEYVGKEFKSTHQYMVIKGDNRDALTAIANVVQGEVMTSSRMIKQCTRIYKNEIEHLLKEVYSDGDE